MRTALMPRSLVDPARNRGFLRAEAKLAVIFVSDEDDASLGQPSDFADFLWSLKRANAATEDVRLYPLVQTTSGSGCGGTAGSRYLAAQSQTGGMVRSVCTTDMTQDLNDIANDIFALKREFRLSRPRDVTAGGLTVTVNGVAKVLGVDFSYDSAGNAVVFGNASVPPAGATVVVNYPPACTP